MLKISIIIPCYNDAAYIQQSVTSALNQTYKNTEIIVVDDGSDRETKKALKNLAPTISKLISQENSGASAARNTGINNSSGEYVVVLDSDDYFEPSFCEKALKLFESHDDAKIVTCYAEHFSNEKTLDVIKPERATLLDFLKYNHALGSVMFAKSDYTAVGGYDEVMTMGFEDWEFYIRLLKRGGTSYVLEEVLFHYRQKNNSNSTRAHQVKYELLQYIYLKHRELYIDNYDDFVRHIIHTMEFIDRTGKNNLRKHEFRLGYFLLTPFRKIRRQLRL